MELVAAVISIALLVYMYITFQVGSARTKYGIEAPAISGHPVFERTYRVQLNTIEQLVVFLPALWICAYLGATTVAAVAGVVFLVARPIYAASYVSSPEKRTIGFVLGYLANIVLIVRAGWAAVALAV